MSKMTKWFPPHIKPVREGVYEVSFKYWSKKGAPMYATWNGEKWSHGDYALHTYKHKCFDAIQEKYWRGFKEKQA